MVKRVYYKCLVRIGSISIAWRRYSADTTASLRPVLTFQLSFISNTFAVLPHVWSLRRFNALELSPLSHNSLFCDFASSLAVCCILSLQPFIMRGS